MNHILKFRHCTSFIRKFCRKAFKDSFNNCTHNYFPLSIKSMWRMDSNLISSTYFYYQIREFAKRAQGKMPKGGKLKTMKLTDEEMADVIDIDDYRQQLHEVEEKLRKEYVEHLCIRSATGNIDNIIVKIDEEEYPLNELAIISKKNPNLIAINMADFPEAIKPAIQAIINSGNGLNPQQDGTMIYLTVPKMTREHRETLAKNAKSLFIKAKDEIRLIQNSFVKDAKGQINLSEDLVFNSTNQIMAMAVHSAANLEKTMKEKQKELLGDS